MLSGTAGPNTDQQEASLYPNAALDLLLHVVPDEPYPTEELSKCLTELQRLKLSSPSRGGSNGCVKSHADSVLDDELDKRWWLR